MTFRFSSLRTALLLPFVGLVAAVALAIGGLSYLTGVRAVEDFSEQILRDVTNRVAQAVSQHLATPKTALNVVAPDAATVSPGATAAVTDIAPQNVEAIEQRLWLATGLFNDVSGYVYYGVADGRFIGVNRGDAGTEVRFKGTPDKQRIAYRSSGPGIRGDELRRDDFDPTKRPWYTSALAANSLAWSPIYIAATSKALTLTLAKPVYDAQHRLHGVVATDLPLTSLDGFIGSLRPSENGVAFIVDAKGGLIATSSSEKLVGEKDGKPIQLNVEASTNALVREAYKAFFAANTEQANARGLLRTYFDSSASGVVDLGVARHKDSAGLDWTILVAMPRADHMASLRKTVIQNIAIGMVAVAMAISFGLWFSQRIARDVTRLSDATRLLASGQAPAALDLKRNDEIGSIAKSMAQMSSGLLTDPLTGALNRATFEKRFSTMFADASSATGIVGALVFIDMNGFKQVNDTYGHTVGDALLAVTAQRLASVLRRTDALGRYGGDEFLLLLTATEQAEIDAVIERCRTQLRDAVVVAGHKLTVDAAFGYALIPNEGTTLQQLIAAADKKMYSEKKGNQRARAART